MQNPASGPFRVIPIPRQGYGVMDTRNGKVARAVWRTPNAAQQGAIAANIQMRGRDMVVREVSAWVLAELCACGFTEVDLRGGVAPEQLLADANARSWPHKPITVNSGLFPPQPAQDVAKDTAADPPFDDDLMALVEGAVDDLLSAMRKPADFQAWFNRV